MKILLAVILSINTVLLFAQEKPARLIVRGDDMGYSHSGNLALMECYKNGIQTSIEVIVPSPWFPEAVKMLQQDTGIDVGVHLALTSEWDNMKWRPLTNAPTLRDADGYFLPMMFPNKNYPGRSVAEAKPSIREIEMEFRAQIEMARKYIPRISHISGHMGCTNLNNEVKAVIAKLTREYNLINENELKQVSYIGFGEQLKTSEEKIERFLVLLDKLEKGKTYLFVEHPGLDNDELKAIHHIGYENVAADRQGVTDMFTSKKVKAKIKEKNIQLIGYRDLR